MQIITALVIALACLSAPFTPAVESPTVPASEQTALPEFDAALNAEGQFGTVLLDGESIKSIVAPGFEIGESELAQDGMNREGVHVRIMSTHAKTIKACDSHVIITIVASDGTERTNEMIVHIHAD